MDGDGVAVGDGAVTGGIEDDDAAVVEANGEAARVGAEDGAEGAVAHADGRGGGGGVEVDDVAAVVVVAQEDMRSPAASSVPATWTPGPSSPAVLRPARTASLSCATSTLR